MPILLVKWSCEIVEKMSRKVWLGFIVMRFSCLFSAPTVSAPELLQLPTATEVIIPSTQVKISHVDTTKYIHIRQQNGTSTRVFRETSVWHHIYDNHLSDLTDSVSIPHLCYFLICTIIKPWPGESSPAPYQFLCWHNR